MPNLSNSLKELGFSITPISGKDENGNEWVYQVTPPPFYVKLTKRGKLKAFKTQADKLETTINGLYGLESTPEGDLVGKRLPTTAKPKAVEAAPVAA